MVINDDEDDEGADKEDDRKKELLRHWSFIFVVRHELQDLNWDICVATFICYNSKKNSETETFEFWF